MATAQQDVSVSPTERFRRDLDALIPPQSAIGLAVSGGPDSLALLLLAAEARPLQIEAATVDHVLRPESRAEAEKVAAVCENLGVPHTILTVKWAERPQTALQERARFMRYRLLGKWARERNLTSVVTAHHLDDQAETFLMRLSRGSGVKGLAGMRRVSRPQGAAVAIVRPLLGWRHAELEAVCASAGIEPIDDPSNEDDQFERVRVRKALQKSNWLDAAAIARSAFNLAEADGALHWAATVEWQRAVNRIGDQISYSPTEAPREIRRRIIRRAILALGSEGGEELRGREIDQVLAALRTGKRATLRGVLCIGGPEWRFTRAPARRRVQRAMSAEVSAVEG